MKTSFHDIKIVNQTAEIVFYVYLVSITLQYIIGPTAIRFAMYFSALMLFIIEFYCLNRRYYIIYLLFIVLLFGMLLEYFINGYLQSPWYYLRYLGNIGTALFLLRVKTSIKGVVVIYWACMAYFILAMLIGVNPNEVIATASRNHVSVIVLSLTILLYIRDYKTDKSLNVIPAVLCGAICLWAIGGGGIVASLILIIGVYMQNKKSKISVPLISGAVISLLILFAYVYDLDFIMRPLYYFVGRRGSLLENVRIDIAIWYFENIDFKSLIYGFDSTFLYDGWLTLHNSYFRIHHNYGIMGIVIMFIIMISVFKAAKYNKVIFLLLLTILIRAITDTILLPGVYDFIFFYLVTYIFYERTNHFISEKKTVSDNTVL